MQLLAAWFFGCFRPPNQLNPPPQPTNQPSNPNPTVKPRHYRERLLNELEGAVRERAAPLLQLCTQHGVPNTKVGCLVVGVTVLICLQDKPSHA
jgi:hypothetical protein